jgi:hypothetical protein
MGAEAYAWESVGVPQSDALLGLLAPAWQILITGCLVIVVLLGLFRLARRGTSRMNTGVLVTGGLAVALVAIGALSQLL